MSTRTQNYGAIKTNSADYPEVKTAIEKMAKAVGKTLDLETLEQDGRVTRSELEKAVYDLDGNGYGLADDVSWKKGLASASAASEGSSVLQGAHAILKKHGLAPTNANNALIVSCQNRLNLIFERGFADQSSPLYGMEEDYPLLQADGIVGPATR